MLDDSMSINCKRSPSDIDEMGPSKFQNSMTIGKGQGSDSRELDSVPEARLADTSSAHSFSRHLKNPIKPHWQGRIFIAQFSNKAHTQRKLVLIINIFDLALVSPSSLAHDIQMTNCCHTTYPSTPALQCKSSNPIHHVTSITSLSHTFPHCHLHL